MANPSTAAFLRQEEEKQSIDVSNAQTQQSTEGEADSAEDHSNTPTERGIEAEKMSVAHSSSSSSSSNTSPPSPAKASTDMTRIRSAGGFSLVDTSRDIGDEENQHNAPIPHPDPNIVDWESPDDPTRALNWSLGAKWSNIGILSFVCLLTPLASSMIAPGVELIMDEFNNDESTIASLIVSIYVLGYAVGPLFLAPLSEVYGRLIVYHVCNFLFVIWTMACALAPNVGAILVFRLFAGIAGSCPITIGAGSISDLFIQEERGAAMALFALGPLLGPVIGPVAGGFLSQAAGWRWVFWVVTIAAGCAASVALVVMRETFEPVLLERKAARLRKETGNPDLRSRLASDIPTQEFFIRALVRPTKMLIFSPIILTLSIYMAIIYGYMYLLFTTMTSVFMGTYGFGRGVVGLAYLGLGLGQIFGLIVFARMSDSMLKRLAAGGEMKPEYRLPPMIPGVFLIPVGLFWYGWSAEAEVHWIMPIIGTGFMGLGILASFMPVSTYMFDAYPQYAASAIGANTVLRSLCGAFLPLAGPSMYDALGLGWGNSLLAFIALACAPLSIIFFRYGERIRTHPRWQLDL